MIGQTISHYRILEELGRGGMGVVYRAEDLTLHRMVALKFLPPHALASGEERDRFTREAQAAAALNHPNIATVFSIDEVEGPSGPQRFIVMEYIEGRSLKDMTAAAPMKITGALDVAIQIAEGLQAAHEKGVIHRDLKSANVMVPEKGPVKVMDFGLAKLKGVSLLTREGTTLGTVSYMSPEQARGEKVDHRTDIWSLGIVLYEMIAGRTPFQGEFEQAVLYAILNADPEPITAVRSGVPMDLERVLRKMLAKDPGDRYQSMQEIPVDLRAIRDELKKASSGSSRVSVSGLRSDMRRESMLHRRVIPWGVAALMGIAAAVSFWSPWRSPAPAPATRFTINLPRGEYLDLANHSALALSPDGRKIVFRSSGHLRLRELGQFGSVEIPGTEGAGSPFFSPDGNWIAFFAEGKLKKVPLSGGGSITLVDGVGDNRGGTWGRDGIVFVPGTTVGLRKVPDSGGPVQIVTTPDSSLQERTHRWPHFIPGTPIVIFTVGSLSQTDYYEEARIDAVNVETGQRKHLIDGASTAWYVPDGHVVYSRSGVLFVEKFNIDDLEVTGTPFPMVEGVGGDPTSGAMNYGISDNGTLVYIPGQIEGAERFLVKITNAGEVVPFQAPPRSYLEPRVSPDGKKVAVTISSGKDFDVWLYDIPRNTLSRLTFGGVNRTPAWSPDGTRISFWGKMGEDKPGIFSRKADGSGETDTLLFDYGRTYIDAWSRNGSAMVLDRPGGQSDIYALQLGNERKAWPFIASQFDEWQASFSPDNKWVAYISNEGGSYDVFVQPFPGRNDPLRRDSRTGKWQISSNGGWRPIWSPDGRRIYYPEGGRMMVVDVATSPTFSPGEPRALFEGFQIGSFIDSGLNYDVFPDGSGFISTRPSREETLQQVNVVLNWTSEIGVVSERSRR